jgi:hypothetical protein
VPDKLTGGSRKGIPNRATRGVREMIAKVAEENAQSFEDWLHDIAVGASTGKPDPAKAAELYLKAIEYHIPKLARTEVAGDQNQPMQMVVTWAQEK